MSSSSSSPPQPPSSCPVPTLTWLPFRRCCCRLVWRHLRPLLVLPEAVQRHVVLGWGRRRTNGAAGSPCLDVQRPSWWRTLGPGIFDKQRMVNSQPAVVLLQTYGQQLSTRPSTAPAETAGAGSSGAAQAPADSLLPSFHQTCALSPLSMLPSCIHCNTSHHDVESAPEIRGTPDGQLMMAVSRRAQLACMQGRLGPVVARRAYAAQQQARM